jgi:hypothetical protein
VVRNCPSSALRHVQGCLRLLGLTGCLAILSFLTGCGHGSQTAPQPERPAAEVLAPASQGAAPPAEDAEVAPPPEPSAEPPSAISSAAVRAYLARRFLYEAWYTKIRNVTMKRRRVILRASLPRDRRGKATARAICTAALEWRRVTKALVEYGSGSFLACS